MLYCISVEYIVTGVHVPANASRCTPTFLHRNPATLILCCLLYYVFLVLHWHIPFLIATPAPFFNVQCLPHCSSLLILTPLSLSLSLLSLSPSPSLPLPLPFPLPLPVPLPLPLPLSPLLPQTKHMFPPPWLIAMQRYGPPPSYPNLKIAGLNGPIPEVT